MKKAQCASVVQNMSAVAEGGLAICSQPLQRRSCKELISVGSHAMISRCKCALAELFSREGTMASARHLILRIFAVHVNRDMAA